MRLAFFAVLLCASNLAIADKATESQPEMLLEPATLVEHFAGRKAIGEENVILLDVRSEEGFEKEHLPGARHIDAGKWKAAFGDGTDGQAWSERIAKALVTLEDGSTVVVYDEAFSPSAARIWWILKYWGVEDVRVLNGGLAAWKSAGGETVSSPTAVPDSPTEFTARPNPDRLATYQDMQQILGAGGETCVVDTRSDEENTAGYIPSATHLNWQELIVAETGKLRPKKQLQTLLDRVEFDPATRTVTYCHSGGRAAVMAFAMELASGKPVANYHGSWSDWTRHGGERAVDSSNTGR